MSHFCMIYETAVKHIHCPQLVKKLVCLLYPTYSDNSQNYYDCHDMRTVQNKVTPHFPV